MSARLVIEAEECRVLTRLARGGPTHGPDKEYRRLPCLKLYAADPWVTLRAALEGGLQSLEWLPRRRVVLLRIATALSAMAALPDTFNSPPDEDGTHVAGQVFRARSCEPHGRSYPYDSVHHGYRRVMHILSGP